MGTSNCAERETSSPPDSGGIAGSASDDTTSVPITGQVVVGVRDDSIGMGVRYGAHEAQVRGCGLRLVHACPSGSDPPAPAMAADLIRRAVDRARELFGRSLEITGTLVDGTPVASVLGASRDAQLVVFEHRDVLRLILALTGGEGGPYTDVAVVCLPDPRSPRRVGARVITVAVQNPAADVPAIRGSLEIARLRGDPVRILHAWWLPRPYDDLVARRIGCGWEESARAEIESALTDDDGTSPLVQIEIQHRSPAEAVVAASRDSELLVLRRHDPRSASGHHLGRVARSALYHSACPVLLLPGGEPVMGSLGGRASRHPTQLPAVQTPGCIPASPRFPTTASDRPPRPRPGDQWSRDPAT